MTPKQYRIDINIVDEHAMVAESMALALNQKGTMHVSRTYKTLESFSQAMSEKRPDVLLFDISIPSGDMIEMCKDIIKAYPRIKIIAATGHNKYSVIKRALDTGIHGYILKNSNIEELVKAILCVWQGENYISPEVESIISKHERQSVNLTVVERHILFHICDGHTNPEIARLLHLSTETVNWYRKRLLAKFHVNNTVKLVNCVMRENIYGFLVQK